MLRRDTVPLECRAQDARNDSLPGRRTEVRPFFFRFPCLILCLRGQSLFSVERCALTQRLVQRLYPGPTRRHKEIVACSHYPNSFEKQLETRGIEE